MYRYVSPLFGLCGALLFSGALLAGAHFFERVVGLAPCLLCLEQREVHWIAVGIAVITLAAWRLSRSEQIAAAGLGALALIYLFSTWLAGFHAGVEWGFWPGPDACAAGGGQQGEVAFGDDLLASMNQPGPAGPSCSEAAWRLIGISMAGYNALLSAIAAVACAFGCYAAWSEGFSRAPDRMARA